MPRGSAHANIKRRVQYPLNLVNLASVQEFDTLVPKDEDLKAVDVHRFRPNIISQSRKYRRWILALHVTNTLYSFRGPGIF